jgi:thiol-disulfide isomerase/thioredoxin
MTVLYFGAPWCGPCKTFKPIVQEVSRELGIPVNDINVDYDATFAQKYDVTSIPTLIILDGYGNVAYRKTGVLGKDQVKNALTSFK